MLVSIVVLKNVQTHQWETKMRKITLGIIVAIFLSIVLFNIAAPSYYLSTEWNFDYQRTYGGNTTTYEYVFRGTIFGVNVYRPDFERCCDGNETTQMKSVGNRIH